MINLITEDGVVASAITVGWTVGKVGDIAVLVSPLAVFDVSGTGTCGASSCPREGGVAVRRLDGTTVTVGVGISAVTSEGSSIRVAARSMRAPAIRPRPTT